MDSCELSEWIAFCQVEPLADPYVHTAQICTVLNDLFGKKLLKLSDFDPRTDWSKPDRRPDAGRLEAEFERKARLHNAGEEYRNQWP